MFRETVSISGQKKTASEVKSGDRLYNIYVTIKRL